MTENVSSHAATSQGLAQISARQAALGDRAADSASLAYFLKSAGPLLRALRLAPDCETKVDLSGFRSAMAAVAGPLQRARNTGILADPWALAQLKRREVANAAVLAGLWRRTTGGESATNFLAAFFDRLRKRPGGETLPDAAILARGYLVRTEDQPMGDERDRIDITIEGGDFLVGIEVKIDAGLQPNQLLRYQAAIRRRAADRNQNAVVIFLSRRRMLDPGFVSAEWSDVVAAGRSVVPILKTSMTINHYLIDRFAAHVARFTGGTV